jgi:hypothetical protein
VPAQLLGRDFKDGLFLRIASADEDLFPDYCAIPVAYGSYATGPQSVFVEFGFLGCLLFSAVARFYRQLWHLASEQTLLGAQVIYIATALLVPFSVVNSLTECFPMFLLAVCVLMPVLWVAREQRPLVFRPPGDIPLQRAPMER